MVIYGLKNCDACRKALKSLENARLVDIRETPLPPVLLEQALAKFGADLVNRRSTTWRGLTEEQRVGAPADLLSAHPALMKRPLIDRDGELFLGWTPDTRSALGAA